MEEELYYPSSENKGADQIRGNREADLRLCFRLCFADCWFSHGVAQLYMSRIVRKPEFRICENKGADQIRSNCEADQRLWFHHSDSKISLLPKSEISSF